MENKIETHYGSANLLDKIKHGLEKAGKDTDALELKDLSIIDQLHTGGHIASIFLAEKADLHQGTKVLDAGCGIGGSSRLLAEKFKCSVTGIDLVEQFIDTAEFLTKSTGITGDINFSQVSILKTPFEDNFFDCIWCQHTLMNIQDKEAAFLEFKRLLRPDGVFVMHEVVQGENSHDKIHLPVPWADRHSLSFLNSWEETDSLLNSMGFICKFQSDQTQQAKIWWHKVKTATEKIAGRDRPLGPHIIFGDNGKFFGNTMTANLDEHMIKVVMAIYCNKKA